MDNKKLYIVAMEKIYDLYKEFKEYRDLNLTNLYKNLSKWIEIDYKLMKDNIFEYEVEDAIIYKKNFREFRLNLDTLKVYYYYLNSVFEMSE